jgi:hypothetical protein
MATEKCEQAGCMEDATRWYLWPGRGRMVACLPHALKASGIMGALGYPLQLNLIRDYDSPPCVACGSPDHVDCGQQ